MPAARTLQQVRDLFAWDARTLRYRKAGRFVSADAVRRALRRVADGARRTVAALTARLTAGEIGVGEWQAAMERAVKDLHLAATAAARGGFGQMTQRDYGLAGARLRAQYEKLAAFAAAVEDGRLSAGRVAQRATMYAAAGVGVYENGRREAARQSAVMTEERRVLGTAEHCADCTAEAAKGWVAIGTLRRLGDSKCKANCKCRFQFRRPPSGSSPTPIVAAAPAGKAPAPAARPAPAPYGGRVEVEGDLAAAARAMGLRVTDAAGVAGIGVPADDVFGEVRVSVRGANGNIRIEAETADGGQIDRTVVRLPDGRVVIHNNLFVLPASARGSARGIDLLARQVANARAAGVDAIETDAARGPGYNGYYTWPRAGYDGEIPALSDAAEAARPAATAGATTFRELMATPAGRAWWREFGDTVAVRFDLRPGSKSVRTLRAYLAERGDRP